MKNERTEAYTCRCRAYRFPHRFGGGKCSGLHLVVEHWDKHWGHDMTCRNCINFDPETHSCEVLNGAEPIRTCEIVITFVLDNSINYKL
jgi:hypothetical protein